MQGEESAAVEGVESTGGDVAGRRTPSASARHLGFAKDRLNRTRSNPGRPRGGRCRIEKERAGVLASVESEAQLSLDSAQINVARLNFDSS
jgi:hypothetical protein